MAKIECKCKQHLPKAKFKYIGFVAKCSSCGDLWYCQRIYRGYPKWQPIGKSSIERLLNG